MTPEEYKLFLESEIEKLRIKANEAEDEGERGWANNHWCTASGVSLALKKFNEVEFCRTRKDK